MLVPFAQLLADARTGGYAVGYFEAWDFYSLEAAAEAAEAENAPVILGLGGVMMDPGWFDGGGLERLAAAGLATAQMALRPRPPSSSMKSPRSARSCAVSGPVSTRGDAGLDRVALRRARAARPARWSRRRTRSASRWRAGLGALPDGSGELGGEIGHMTDPDEAARFVAETGVDALAVSVGNVHILLDGQSRFDGPRARAALRQAVSVPLALRVRLRLPGRGHPRRLLGAGNRLPR